MKHRSSFPIKMKIQDKDTCYHYWIVLKGLAQWFSTPFSCPEHWRDVCWFPAAIMLPMQWFPTKLRWAKGWRGLIYYSLICITRQNKRSKDSPKLFIKKSYFYSLYTWALNNNLFSWFGKKLVINIWHLKKVPWGNYRALRMNCNNGKRRESYLKCRLSSST